MSPAIESARPRLNAWKAIRHATTSTDRAHPRHRLTVVPGARPRPLHDEVEPDLSAIRNALRRRLHCDGGVQPAVPPVGADRHTNSRARRWTATGAALDTHVERIVSTTGDPMRLVRDRAGP